MGSRGGNALRKGLVGEAGRAMVLPICSVAPLASTACSCSGYKRPPALQVGGCAHLRLRHDQIRDSFLLTHYPDARTHALIEVLGVNTTIADAEMCCAP